MGMTSYPLLSQPPLSPGGGYFVWPCRLAASYDTVAAAERALRG